MHRYILLPALALTVGGLSPAAGQGDAPEVPLWGRFEAKCTLTEAKPDPDLYDIVAVFQSPTKKEHKVPAFWDGGNVWRARFRPDEVGDWKYALTGLDAQKRATVLAFGKFSCTAAKADNRLAQHGPVRVAKAGTHLEHADGTPFFWLGDTVWTGPAFSTAADWKDYLADRQKKKFSVVQFNAVCPWRTAPTDLEKETAFTDLQLIKINPAYFKRLDARMDAINDAGLVAAPVLIWALTQKDPGIYLREEDCIKLAKYLIARYQAHHVVWILAGDNPYNKESAERWKKVGRAVFGDGPHAPVTTHPTGMNWPWDTWKDEKWLDVLGYQSGHGDDAKTLKWIHSGPVSQAWKKQTKPIINLEPPYEDHLGYQSRKPHPAYHTRRAVYWSLLAAPVAGVTYGGHGLWSWQTVPGKTPPDHASTGVAKTWREALELPGGGQMTHVVDLFTSLPWTQLRPAPELLAEQPGGADPAKFIAAAWAPDATTAVLYLPVGGVVQLAKGKLPEGLKGTWFDPRTGKRTAAEGTLRFEAPDGQDWVLVLARK
jgi:hypothetical protein